MDGMYKAALTEPPYPRDNISDIAVTKRGHIAYVGWSSDFVAVFNHNGNYLNRFKATRTTTDHNMTGIAVDKDGNFLVWDSQQRVVTCHSCPDGKLLKEVKVATEMPDLPRLAVHGKTLFFYDDNASSENDVKVMAMDYFGKLKFTINPQIGDRDTGRTYTGMEVGLCGLVIGNNGDMFIAMKVSIPNIGCYGGRIGSANTGHIHRYTSAGEFQQCIVQALHSPYDLAITSDDLLIIANDDKIQKISQISEGDGDNRRGETRPFEADESEEMSVSSAVSPLKRNRYQQDDDPNYNFLN